MLDDTFVKNLVQIGQETAEKRWREKKKDKTRNWPAVTATPEIYYRFCSLVTNKPTFGRDRDAQNTFLLNRDLNFQPIFMKFAGIVGSGHLRKII